MMNLVYSSDTSSSTIRFLLVFSVVYIVFHGLYFIVPDPFLANVMYHNGIVAVAKNIINFCTPWETTQAVANKLVSSKASLEIVRGCDGAGATFLLMAAIIASKASWKEKLVGLGISLLLMFFINQVRIIGLYFIVAYRYSWFEIVHTYLAPTLIIIISCLFFFSWIVWSAKSGSMKDETQPA